MIGNAMNAPSIRPLSIVAILAVIGISLWLRDKEADRGTAVVAAPGNPVVIPKRLLAEGSPARVETASDRRVKAEVDRQIERDEDRTQLLDLMREAQQLSQTAESLALAGQPLTTEIRITEVQKLVEGIAHDTLFADLRQAATEGGQAIKSRRTTPISAAVKTVEALPAQ